MERGDERDMQTFTGGLGYLVAHTAFKAFVFDDLQGRGTSITRATEPLVGFSIAVGHAQDNFEWL